jgi:RNA-directed DNA polymerase
MNPSPEAIQEVKRQLKGLWRQQVGSPTIARINAMNPVIRGWSNSFRVGVSKEVFTDVDAFMSQRAYRSMKRRHPKKAGWWCTEKYWGQTPGRQGRWVFQDKERDGTLRKFAWTKIVRHRLVPTTFSPDDPTLQEYGQQRRAKPQVTALRRRQLVHRQQGICPVCHQHLDNGEELHIHQVVPKKSGGKDDLANLRLVHHHCHHQMHSNSAPLGVRRWLEPCTR